MSFQQLLIRLSEILDTAHVAYMLTGSYASSVHGTPRASQDIDIVIAPNRPQLLALLKLLLRLAFVLCGGKGAVSDGEHWFDDDADALAWLIDHRGVEAEGG